MNSKIESETNDAKTVDPRTYKKSDRIAYTGIALYSLINILWVVWAVSGAGFGIFDTAGIIGLVVPITGFLTLVFYQSSSRRNKFSALANIISIASIGGWFFFVWYIVAAASAAV